MTTRKNVEDFSFKNMLIVRNQYVSSICVLLPNRLKYGRQFGTWGLDLGNWAVNNVVCFAAWLFCSLLPSGDRKLGTLSVVQ